MEKETLQRAQDLLNAAIAQRIVALNNWANVHKGAAA